MSLLSNLKDTHRAPKRSKRVGRGPGSGLGKTSGRGEKGAGSRSGYKRRLTNEGGQVPLFKKLPTRGFSNARFRKPYHTINLGLIDQMFSDGDVVNLITLSEHGFLSGTSYGLKVLGDGELKKKVTIEANAFSKSAKEKLEKAGIEFKEI